MAKYAQDRSRDFVPLAGGVLEISRVDHGPIGEAETITTLHSSCGQGLGMADEEALGDHQIAVDEDDHITTGMIHTAVAPLGWSAVGLLNKPHMGELVLPVMEPIDGSIRGPVVNHHHLKAFEGITACCRSSATQALLKNREAVVRRNDNADPHRSNRNGGLEP